CREASDRPDNHPRDIASGHAPDEAVAERIGVARGARSRQQLSEDPGGSGQNSLTGEASQYRQERGAEISAIAGKRLITAVTGKDDFNMSSRVLRQGECWDSRGVREGLVVMPRTLWNKPGN